MWGIFGSLYLWLIPGFPFLFWNCVVENLCGNDTVPFHATSLFLYPRKNIKKPDFSWGYVRKRPTTWNGWKRFGADFPIRRNTLWESRNEWIHQSLVLRKNCFWVFENNNWCIITHKFTYFLKLCFLWVFYVALFITTFSLRGDLFDICYNRPVKFHAFHM